MHALIASLPTLTRSIGPSGPISFCDVAKTRNQCNIATALDRFPTEHPRLAFRIL
jgi:hypothetical protein